jgi:hypothetical protein
MARDSPVALLPPEEPKTLPKLLCSLRSSYSSTPIFSSLAVPRVAHVRHGCVVRGQRVGQHRMRTPRARAEAKACCMSRPGTK